MWINTLKILKIITSLLFIISEDRFSISFVVETLYYINYIHKFPNNIFPHISSMYGQRLVTFSICIDNGTILPKTWEKTGLYHNNK